MVRIVE
jgi:hypothetical protein